MFEVSNIGLFNPNMIVDNYALNKRDAQNGRLFLSSALKVLTATTSIVEVGTICDEHI